MTHTELMRAIASKTDLKPEEASILWRETSAILIEELAKHQKIRIKNFGAFVVIRHKSRTVPDPRELTKKLVILDQYLPKFRPSEAIRKLVKDVIPAQTEEAELGPEEPAIAPSKPPIAAQPVAKANPTPPPPIAPAAPTKPNETKPTPTQASPAPAAPSTTSDDPIQALSQKSVNIGYADLSGMTIDKEVLNLIPAHLAKKYQMVAIEKNNDTVIVAMIDPGDREAIDLVARQTGLKVEPRITTSQDIQHGLDQYGSISSEFDEMVDQEGATEATTEAANQEAEATATDTETPASKVVRSLLERSVREKASDIHIEPDEKGVIVRFRIDGLLQQVLELPKTLQASVTSRLKIMSNLKIDESRLPQDGRLRIVVDHNTIDFRLSTLPTVNGEKIVMRILDKSAGILTFDELGLKDDNLKRVDDNITKSHGMLLVTGPTGSGKTTTLYAVIGKIMSPTVNITTMEDPVEYRIQGINQSQVNAEIGFDFASGLRSIVRQDPDVILVGEIRDLETAEMAIHSALTGHIVLSTLHTNDAAGALPRLIDMGIEPFLITSSTNAVVAQRLVRKLCDRCRETIELPEESLKEVRAEVDRLPAAYKEAYKDAITTFKFKKGKGCSQCNNSGYRGRIGIFEVLSVSETIKELALKRVSSSEITKQAIAEGMITLKQDGILKALTGETSLEEVWRVTKD